VTIVLPVCVGVFMVSLDLFIVNIAFPDMQESFSGTSLSDLSWILNAYAIAFGALLVPAGRWADRVGRKSVYLTGLAIFTVASAACAAAPSVLALVIARAIQAVGAAMVFPASLGLLLPEWPAEKRGIPVGIWSAVSGVAAAAAPPLGGVIVQADWRWVFIVNLPIGIAAFVIGWRSLVNTRDEHAKGRPDVIGAGLFTVAIAALLLAIVQGQSWGWSSGRVIALFATAAVLTAVVAVRCVRHPLPLVEPLIVRTRAIAFANLGAILFFIAFATFLLSMVLFQTQVWRVSVLTAGLQIAPAPVMSAIFAVPGAVLGERLGQRYVGAAGVVLSMISIFWFRSQAELEPDFASVLLPSALLGGAGIGLVLPTLAAAATGPLPPSRFATGTAVLGMTRQVGSALGVALFVAILGGSSVATTAATALHDYRDVWTFLIGSLFAAGVAILAIGPVRIATAEDSGEDAAAEPAGAGAPAFATYGNQPIESGSTRR
jgi:EmrB/QacA subfamily drug resistance transporter